MAYTESQRMLIEENRRAFGTALAEMRRLNLFWHVTSKRGFQSILTSGTIAPNFGSFPFTYHISRTSLGHQIGAVSLFDFNSNSEDEVLLQCSKWTGFFSSHGEDTVAIGISSQALDSKVLLPPLAVRNRFLNEIRVKERAPTIIPTVEALYIGHIPTWTFRVALWRPSLRTNSFNTVKLNLEQRSDGPSNNRPES